MTFTGSSFPDVSPVATAAVAKARTDRTVNAVLRTDEVEPRGPHHTRRAVGPRGRGGRARQGDARLRLRGGPVEGRRPEAGHRHHRLAGRRGAGPHRARPAADA